ncbi:hypothetical protein MDA_GLEAN10007867 [Myotis davidii]|uniref:Uncharacterized protein n=1 Tax=Myotis davidii TaxID=225400 RepID=L5M758_MYODS|nr:hypothetical protein MDA_GLEAN10007867 [Myotis davidii]
MGWNESPGHHRETKAQKSRVALHGDRFTPLLSPQTTLGRASHPDLQTREGTTHSFLIFRKTDKEKLPLLSGGVSLQGHLALKIAPPPPPSNGPLPQVELGSHWDRLQKENPNPSDGSKL